MGIVSLTFENHHLSILFSQKTSGRVAKTVKSGQRLNRTKFISWVIKINYIIISYITVWHKIKSNAFNRSGRSTSVPRLD